ncbi:MAG TPA: hypothetical protein VFV87_07745, partial [Pirellulaceae bacterium]|nr:hypothetical protein [Pirellulaceae bacterium]
MAVSNRSRWLLVLAALVGIVLTAYIARSRVEHWTRAQLAARHQRQLARLAVEDAVLLVARLAEADDEYLDIVVLALADSRPQVTDAARQALAGRVQLWSHWPVGDSSPRVAALADLLARSAEQIPAERRWFTQSLAAQLLVWPVDGRGVDTQQLIADCERVLRLPTVQP